MPSIPPQSPANLAVLLQYVQQSSVTCHCHQCPQSLENGCNRMHSNIPLRHSHGTRSRGKTTLEDGKGYEAMHLAQSAIDYFTKAEIDMTPIQKDALFEFRKIDLRFFGLDDAREVSEDILKQVLDIFNRLFFFGSIEATIGWSDISRSRSGFRTFGRYVGSLRVIELDPSAKRAESTSSDQLKVERLSTLLHEALHAFLKQRSCSHCSGCDRNVEHAQGHGWAFQLLASKLEDVSYSLTGLRLHLHGFDGIECHWDQLRCLPSMHNLLNWGWIDSNQQPLEGRAA